MSSANADNSRPGAASAAYLFVLLWDTLANILGTAATATLIARAVKRALPSAPVLAELSITIKKFIYEYRVPESWRAPDNAVANAALDQLLEQLIPLLTALTGHVVVRQMARLEPFSAKCLLVQKEPPL